MNDLEMRDITFLGCNFLGARDSNGIIYVQAESVLQFIGFTKSRTKKEIIELKRREDLQRAISFFDWPVNNRYVRGVGIEVSAITIWIDDILVSHKIYNSNQFFGYRLCQIMSGFKEAANLAFDDSVQVKAQYESRFELLNQKMDLALEGMSKLTQFLIHSMQTLTASKQVTLPNKGTSKRQSTSTTVIDQDSYDAYSQWREAVKYSAKKLIGINHWGTQKAVLQHVYDYMTTNYGIVWEQMIKDYMELHECSRKPSILEVVYGHETVKSIFDSILKDLVNENSDLTIEETIEPLIDIYQDKSNAGMATWRRVYKCMTFIFKVDWDREKEYYFNNYHEPAANKKIMIEASSTLKRQFETTVGCMLSELKEQQIGEGRLLS